MTLLNAGFSDAEFIQTGPLNLALKDVNITINAQRCMEPSTTIVPLSRESTGVHLTANIVLHNASPHVALAFLDTLSMCWKALDHIPRITGPLIL